MKIARARGVKISSLWLMVLSLSMAFTAPTTLASSGGATFAEGVNYLPIKPALIVNYGGAGKVKYIKAEISMRVEDAHAAAEVTHHMPLVRDTLIRLLSSMTDEQVSSGEGKEQMRQQALAKVNEALAVQLGHAAEEHGKGDEKSKDEKKDDHAKDDHGKDDHAKDSHAKDEKSKDKKEKSGHDDHGKTAEHKPLVTDLLFDNLVVQR